MVAEIVGLYENSEVRFDIEWGPFARPKEIMERWQGVPNPTTCREGDAILRYYATQGISGAHVSGTSTPFSATERRRYQARDESKLIAVTQFGGVA